MRTFTRYLLPAVLGTFLCAGPTWACLNDREIENAEREFKSQYQQQPRQQPAEPPATGDQLKFYLPLALGGFLLAGAGWQTWRFSRGK